MDDVVKLRTRRERAADTLLDASENLKTSMDDLAEMAAIAVEMAVQRGIPEQDLAAIRSASDLVIKATDVLAATVEAVGAKTADQSLH